MGIELDSDLEKVMQFMESNIQADKLVPIANTIAALAPVLWADLTPLLESRMVSLTSVSRRGQLSIATQSALGRPCAGDGSAAETDTLSRM